MLYVGPLSLLSHDFLCPIDFDSGLRRLQILCPMFNDRTKVVSSLLLYKMLRDFNDRLKSLPLLNHISKILLSLLPLKTKHNPEPNIPPSEPNMTQQPSVVPTLLSLPGELKSSILDHCLSIKKNRVEHDRYWCELGAAEFCHMVGKIDPTAGDCTSDREHSQKGYMTEVDCNLSVSMMHANQELYRVGRHIMREENKFVKIRGWTDDDFEALFELGSIPIWSYEPIRHMDTLVTQRLPCLVEPVLQFNNYSGKGHTILIYIKDLPLACKAMYHCRTSSRPESNTLLSMDLRAPATGLTPVFWDFETDVEVKDFLNRGVIRYLGTCIQTISVNSKPWRRNDVPEPGSRPLNELEEWILNHVQPHLDELEVTKVQNMLESALADFARAEELITSEEGVAEAIGHYVECKDLVHQMSKEEYVFELDLDDEVFQDLFMRYSFCCYRLSCIVAHLDDGIAAAQWAYINCLEALCMVQHAASEPQVRLALLLILANLQLALPEFSDLAVASTLCLAIYEILEHGEPDLEHHELVAATSEQFKGVEGPPPPRGWEATWTEAHGVRFPMRSTVGYALGRALPQLPFEQWESKFKQARALLQSHIIKGPESESESETED